MPVLMIRYQVTDEGSAHVRAAIESTFAALRAEQPTGIRFAYGRSAGGNEFIGVLELAVGVENPLPTIAAARDLQATVATWAVGGPPTPQPIELLATYGFGSIGAAAGADFLGS